MKSLAVLGGHYKLNQFIDGKGDAVLSIFIIGNYLKSGLVNSWKRGQLASVLQPLLSEISLP